MNNLMQSRNVNIKYYICVYIYIYIYIYISLYDYSVHKVYIAATYFIPLSVVDRLFLMDFYFYISFVT